MKKRFIQTILGDAVYTREVPQGGVFLKKDKGTWHEFDVYFNTYDGYLYAVDMI